MAKQSDNMTLWNTVCETDPAHTKHVNLRGGFTAIGAQYQVRRATEQFGSVGVGWGYVCEHSIQEGLAICDLILWHGDRANTFGPVRGMNVLAQKNGIDDDAAKKAMTDALTKALSHLGFSADVFLGRYDDNKYVADLQKKFANGDTPPAASAPPAAPTDDFDKELGQNRAEAEARVSDSFGKMTAEQKKQMGILSVLLQEKADAELAGAKVDKRLLAGWVLEVSRVGYPSTEDERKLIEPKASAKIIQTRLIAKAASAA